jgi:hypothetical protein
LRESRYYDAYSVGGSLPAADGTDRCSVRFWNLSGRDVVLTVDGQSVYLAAGRSMTRELPRQFVWQVQGRAGQGERVPAGEGALEIVIRR